MLANGSAKVTPPPGGSVEVINNAKVDAPKKADAPHPTNPVLGLSPLEHANQVTCCQFSNDGTLLATGGKDGVIKLWDVATGKERSTLVHRDAVMNIAFSPLSRTLASWSKRSLPGRSAQWTVKFWDLASGKERPVLPTNQPLIGPVAFSSNRRFLATGGPNHTVQIWDTISLKVIGTLAGHTADLTCLNFSPDGKLLASGSQACVMKLWSVADQRELLTLEETGTKASWCPYIHSLVFSRDSKLLVLGMGAFTLVYDLGASKQLWKKRTHIWAAFSLALTPDDRYIVGAGTGGDGNHFVVVDALSGQTVRSIPAWRSYQDGYKGAEGIALSPDGRLLASGGPDHTIKIWNTANWQEIVPP